MPICRLYRVCLSHRTLASSLQTCFWISFHSAVTSASQLTLILTRDAILQSLLYNSILVPPPCSTIVLDLSCHDSPGAALTIFASWLLYFISLIEFNAMRTRTTSALPIPVCAALNLAVGPQGAFLKIHVCPERKDYGAVLCLTSITTQREHPFVGQGTKEAKTKKHCHLP